jgi:hypothetical protein
MSRMYAYRNFRFPLHSLALSPSPFTPSCIDEKEDHSPAGVSRSAATVRTAPIYFHKGFAKPIYEVMPPAAEAEVDTIAADQVKPEAVDFLEELLQPATKVEVPTNVQFKPDAVSSAAGNLEDWFRELPQQGRTEVAHAAETEVYTNVQFKPEAVASAAEMPEEEVPQRRRTVRLSIPHGHLKIVRLRRRVESSSLLPVIAGCSSRIADFALFVHHSISNLTTPSSPALLHSNCTAYREKSVPTVEIRLIKTGRTVERRQSCGQVFVHSRSFH